MGLPLRVLIVEDSPDDAALLLRDLRRGGFDAVAERVDTAAALGAALEAAPWDLVISDYSMPQFSGVAALEQVKAARPELPFILVSGTVGEDTAVEAMRAGAHDYLVKGNYTRLVPAVQRELREAQARRAHALADERLRLSESLLAEAQQLAHIGSWSWDLVDGTLLWSDEHYRIVGLDPRTTPPSYDAFLSRTHPDDHRTIQEAVDRALADGRPFECRVRLLHAGGAVRVAESRGRAMLDAAGSPVRMFGTLQDVTDQTRADEALRTSDERFRTIARATNDAIWDWDMLANTIWWSEGFQAMFGYAAAEIEPGPESWYTRLHPDDHRRVSGGIQAIHAGGGQMWSDQYRFRRADGSYAHVLDRGFVIRDGGGRPTRMIGAMMDVSQRVAFEDELRAAKAELEDRVDERTWELKAAMDGARVSQAAAEEATRAKSDFLARMSHEIRTPLNGVIGMADLLLGTDLADRQRRYAEVVKSSGESLLNVINDILDFSKIEAGKLEVSEADFDLRGCAEEVVEMLAPRATSKGLELACHVSGDLPDVVRGDADRVRQVLINLAGNAVKFTDRGSVVVRVTVEGIEAIRGVDAMTVRVAVTDTGVGIPPHDLDRLFKSFSQVDASATRRHGGTGLGLAISKQLAELMGGTVGVDSEPGRGSTFWFTVRLGRPAAAPAPAPRWAFDPAAVRVLAVDDSAIQREILKQQLGAWGFDGELADDGATAVAILAQAAESRRPFGLAILDADMPGGAGGVDVAGMIRRRCELDGLPMILLSPLDGELDATTLKRAGFAGQVVKPVRQSMLFDAIATALVAAKAPAPDGAGTAATTARTARRLRVLLAEDNRVNQLVAVEILSQAGHQCDVVDTGVKAVEAVAAARYDLVLMDCQMPEMDGFEATRAIRRAEAADPSAAARPVPIVALTANAIKGDRERCLAAGMNGYVSKPIDPKRLAEALRTFAVAAEAPSGAAPRAGTPAVPTVQAAAPAEPNDVPPFDTAALLERCLGNLGVAEMILSEFEKQAAGDVRHIEMLVEAGDAVRVAQVAHALKGAAGILSAEMLRDVASELEQLARAANWAGVRGRLAPLRDQAQRCLNYLPISRRGLADRHQGNP